MPSVFLHMLQQWVACQVTWKPQLGLAQAAPVPSHLLLSLPFSVLSWLSPSVELARAGASHSSAWLSQSVELAGADACC